MARSIFASPDERLDETAALGSAPMLISAAKLTFSLLLVSFIGISGPARAAGTIPGISMTQQLDEFAKPLIGGKLFLIQAGTVGAPQNCYQDAALTLAWPNPITLDAAGRVPQLFCADGSIKIRLTDRNGVQKLVQDGLLIVGPSGGGGGGGTVDPTTVLATGDMKVAYGTGILSGFVRANGRTIGSATSGAAERANSDVQALFVYLWGADANLAVSGGRGTSGAADWAANKTITLPDARGRGIAGLDDMGNSAAGRLTLSYFGAAPTTLGAVGGLQYHTLLLSELPTGIQSQNASFGISVTSTTSDIAHRFSSLASGANIGFGTYSDGNVTSTGTVSAGTVSSTSNNTNGSAHSIVPPTILATIYIKI
ncbi:hypothetical protein ABIB06_004903 [Bradyrhizobium sp. LB8.2]|uniref:hypothetical protein n=1 Tax=Bradyrhizobium sp. LB8.2 TaxID=3156330 RepID=UPI003390D214